MRTGEDVRDSTPDSRASWRSKPGIFSPKAWMPSFRLSQIKSGRHRLRSVRTQPPLCTGRTWPYSVLGMPSQKSPNCCTGTRPSPPAFFAWGVGCLLKLSGKFYTRERPLPFKILRCHCDNDSAIGVGAPPAAVAHSIDSGGLGF